VKKIIVGIAGDAPLLMHNPLGMGRGTSGGRKVVPSAVDEAAAARYLLPDGKTLCIHADHVHRCLEIASRGFRVRAKEMLGPYVSGSISIAPDLISLRTAKYTVDERRVVVQRAGVMRARPLIWPWSAEFELHFDDDVIQPEFMDKVFREQVCKRAGKAIGILEYRPKFGRWHITKWEA
jgi:hypothetical protein